MANLLFAGKMWASFVSYNQALEHTGCPILPIAGNFSIVEIVPKGAIQRNPRTGMIRIVVDERK